MASARFWRATARVRIVSGGGGGGGGGGGANFVGLLQPPAPPMRVESRRPSRVRADGRRARAQQCREPTLFGRSVA